MDGTPTSAVCAGEIGAGRSARTACPAAAAAVSAGGGTAAEDCRGAGFTATGWGWGWLLGKPGGTNGGRPPGKGPPGGIWSARMT